MLSALVIFSPGTGHSYFLAFSEGLEEVDKRKKWPYLDPVEKDNKNTEE